MELCDYGCGQMARYVLSNGKQCCKNHYCKCSALKRKNSNGVKKAHKENPNMKCHIIKGKMTGWDENWSYHNKKQGRYKKSDEEVFIKYSTYPTIDIKDRLIKQLIVMKKCNICGISKWQSKKITLHLHHKNGNSFDNRIINLELLCPNCHSLTDSYAGKSKNDGVRKVSDKKLMKALSEEKNIRQALLKVGLAAKGANYNRAKKLSAQLETIGVEPFKFGETLTENADGNPEPSSFKEKV